MVSILRKIILGAALVLGLGAFASCSRFDLVNIDPDEFEGKIDSGIVFDPEHDLTLDIYRLESDAGTPRPTVVFFHGGSWQYGSRKDYQFVGVELARRGFNVVIPDYRKYPAVRYPAFVEDAAAAFAWVHREIDGYGGDPTRIIVSGHSAGAHSAVMLATDGRFLARHALSPTTIRGVIGLAGPYHFTPRSKTLTKIFNGAENFPDMQASNFVDGDEPPMVLLHGEEDSTVNRINIRRLSAALEQTGICHQKRFYPEVGHIGMIGAFTWAYESEPIVSDVEGFVRQLADGAICKT
jgi:acetyl esterase/lipase